MLPLRYRAFWIAASLAMVVIVIWGSLQTAFATPPVQGFDKVEHFLTYMFLAVWFTGLFVRPHWWRIVAGLLALGLAMEIGQYLMHAGRMRSASGRNGVRVSAATIRSSAPRRR